MKDSSFDKFRKKIIIESLIKSIACGISISLFCETIFIVLCKRIPLNVHVIIHVLFTLIISILFSNIFYKKVFYVSDKKIALRLDKDANLNERCQTMVEFKDDNSLLAFLQRKDTYDKLEKTSCKTLKFKFSISTLVMFVITMSLFVSSLFIESKKITPEADDTSSEEEIVSSEENSSSEDFSSSEDSSSSEQENQESSGIDEAFENMKEEVDKNEGLNDQNKEDIKSDLDDLKEQITDENNENKEESIDQSKEEIDQKLDDQITKDEIGEALQNQDSTNEVGKGVSNGDKDQTSSSLEELRESLSSLTGQELKDALEDIASDIKAALSQSQVDESDELYQAFDKFADNLNENAQNVADSDIQEQIDQTFNQAIEDISNALDKQNAIEDLKESLDQQLEDLKEQVSDNSSSNNQNNEGNEEGSGGGGGNGASSGSGDIIYASDDLIYDPITGQYVTYGEVLSYYYSLMLIDMENGEIPEDLQSLINDYFSSLYFEGEN
ncbi:MAG: apolipoprotein A1/A4/E family protein [Erysipelotrichaceae bacterium]|nr:apolipoprotein A1/A4/E family protein [Erysipelotrichaceae bacterium]